MSGGLSHSSQEGLKFVGQSYKSYSKGWQGWLKPGTASVFRMTYHSESCQAKKDDSLVGGEIDACKVMSYIEWIGINHSLSPSSRPRIHQMKLSGDKFETEMLDSSCNV